MFGDVLDVDNVCRLCLNSDGVMSGIYENKVNDENQTRHSLRDKILLLASVQISPDDGVTCLICHTCKNKIEQFVKFKEQIEYSYQVLCQCIGVNTNEKSCLGNEIRKNNIIQATPSTSSLIDIHTIHSYSKGSKGTNARTNQSSSNISSLFKDHLVSGISENEILVSQDFTFVNTSNTSYINDTDNYMSISLTDDPISVANSTANILHKDTQMDCSNKDNVMYAKSYDAVKYNVSFSENNDDNLQDVFLGLDNDSCQDGFEDISKYLKNSHGLDIKKLKEDYKSKESCVSIDQETIKRKLLNSGISLIKSPVNDATKTVKQITPTKSNAVTNNKPIPRNITEIIKQEERNNKKDEECDANNFPDMIFAKMSAIEKDKYTMNDNQQEIAPRIVRLTHLHPDQMDSQFKFLTYLCHLCLMEFRECSINALKDHAVSHFNTRDVKAVCQNEPTFNCEDCSERFTSRHAFINHQRKMLNIKVFACETCGKSFWFKDRLNSHIRIHTKNANSFPCIFCGETFDKKHELQSHELSHTRDTPLICQYCDKECVSVVALKSHLKRHTESMKYCCEVCGKGFYSMSELQRHEQGHSGIRKFPCQFCPKAFCSNSERKRHLQYHFKNKRFQCPECDKKFYEAGHLKTHLNTHNNIRPFVCDICASAFYTKHKLKRHLNNHYKRKSVYRKIGDDVTLTKNTPNKNVTVVEPKFTKLCNVNINSEGNSVSNILACLPKEDDDSEDEESYIIVQEEGDMLDDVDGNLLNTEDVQTFAANDGEIFYIVDDNANDSQDS